MLAAVLHGREDLRIEDIEPVPLRPGEVRVRNEAAGLNFIDIYFRTGLYPAPSMPFIPGGEAAGKIAAVGPDVKRFRVGDRVAYLAPLGCYAQERNVPAKMLVPLPDGITTRQAAGMMLKGLTVQYLVRQTWKLKAGETILVHAAAGGVGQILVQWAKHIGATVIGPVGDKDKAKLVRKLGCDHVILYRDEDFVAKVREITGGKLCDVVYDGVGKATFPGSLDCLRPLGTFVSFGSASGPVDAFNIGLLQQKGSLFATRPTLFHYIAKREDLDAMAKDLFKAVKNGDVVIPIHARYALADVAEAHRALEARETTGAAILIP
jgi:NADPH2:quinone reductase